MEIEELCEQREENCKAGEFYKLMMMIYLFIFQIRSR